jgi:hypothetical protein
MSVVGGRLSARLSARVRFVARLRAALEGGWNYQSDMQEAMVQELGGAQELGRR